MGSAFVDYVKIYVKSGSGGNGVINFRREKFVPKGGPDGGDGGKGGDVILKADGQMTTLIDFKYKSQFIAKDGKHGSIAQRTGSNGADVIIRIPVGTLVSDGENDIIDMIEDGQEFIIAKGGDGGQGNQHFATSTNRVPRKQTDGFPGEEKTIILELKMIADVGLAGLPNAGKSTLLSKITSANPKIAPYPFTTMHPNLGVYQDEVGKRIIFADLPGLIEGASRGAGLGDRFLRHVERTGMLVQLVAFEEGEYNFENLFYAYKLILKELEVYSKLLLKKKRIVVLNKTDLVDEESVKDAIKQFKKHKVNVIPISAKDEQGLDKLIEKVKEFFNKDE